MKTRPDREPAQSSPTDLFGWLDAIWTKARPEGTPPTFMMHRFLASEPMYADVARWLQLQVREPDLVFRIWQGLVPRGRGAPRLQYVVAKKPAKEEELVTRMCSVLGMSRSTAEAELAIVKMAGKEAALYKEFGVEVPKRD